MRSSPNPQHLKEAREREEKERAERGQMATLLSDLHLRINGIEAHRTAPTGEPTSGGGWVCT